ncbi:MAG: tRNA (Uracil54-C5-)-methyltransferase [Parcubacteria group bacterium Gr01-1014_18]|nr:MAG: tRNA (Uracil54-C5-)-methyltransferase [Parcubacteria group bacterium Greene0416_36]TSC81393.1 MAG: tRNA (Uracil54-C5-)-methyltransferase [Parcubacteria group bacterium Gr01-1014_18]TSC99421.1 MAG: tRNA (Uracil54-C5-)-methyltransferase [Parcubacteria group bacterium Greene1014_20]TSD07660.1 MAG: tRNA (Uracil54-C5-)-methyltransferase [Parcubacteria group bacterium Greene0714_2]
MNMNYRITATTHAGFSKAKSTDGKDFIVPFGCPEDEVELEIFGRPGNKKAAISKIINPSPRRVPCRCPHAGSVGSVFKKCGGCSFQYIDYPKQLEEKKRLILEEMARKKVTDPVADVIPSPQIFGYRNRMDFVVGANKELGLREKGSFRHMVDLKECHLISPKMDAVRKMLRTWLEKSPIVGWNRETDKGHLRYIVLRETKNTGQLAVIFITYEENIDEYWDDLSSILPPEVTHVFCGVQTTASDTSVAENYQVYKGKDYLEESIGGVTYLIRPGSFFQTNTDGATKLLDYVLGLSQKTGAKHILDWYCGSGFFSLPMAKHAQEVVGVELDPAAIAVAKESVALNKITNAKFYDMDVIDFPLDSKYDLLIVDPPRAGLHPKVLAHILEIKIPHLIYVSCNFEALAFQLKLLGQVYDIESIHPFDLFPHTPHVEVVVKMKVKS